MVKRLEQKKDPLETVIFQNFKNSTKLFCDVFVIIFRNTWFYVVRQIFDKEIQHFSPVWANCSC